MYLYWIMHAVKFVPASYQVERIVLALEDFLLLLN